MRLFTPGLRELRGLYHAQKRIDHRQINANLGYIRKESKKARGAANVKVGHMEHRLRVCQGQSLVSSLFHNVTVCVSRVENGQVWARYDSVSSDASRKKVWCVTALALVAVGIWESHAGTSATNVNHMKTATSIRQLLRA